MSDSEIDSEHVSWWRIRLDETEAQAAFDAVMGGKLSQGSITAELEAALAEKLDVPYVTMTTSGSTALATALIAAGVGVGDEVIVPNRTFIASAHAVQLIGATVRLVDTLADRPVIDPAQIERHITKNTKAIIAVHLNGCACEMSALKEIAERDDLAIIEDSAQALFSRHGDQYLGTFGLFGCFSLGVAKFMTSGQGGFLVTRDKAAHDRAQRMRFHGVVSPRQGSYDKFGFNFRFTDIQAAIMLRQLARLEPKMRAHKALYRRYLEALPEGGKVRLIPVWVDAGELPLWIEAVCEQRQELMDFLTARGIDTLITTGDLSEAPHLKTDGAFPNSSRFAASQLTLPSGPDQPSSAIDKTLRVLAEFEAGFV